MTHTYETQNTTLRAIIRMLSDGKARTFAEISSWIGISLQKARALCWVLYYCDAVTIGAKRTFFGKTTVVKLKGSLDECYAKIAT
jgi:hypothetical protein